MDFMFWALFLFLSPFLASSETTKHAHQNFIVRIQNDVKPSEYSGVEEWYGSTLRSLNSDPLGESGSESESPGFLHVYKTVFHGFAARMTREQAEELKTRPGVLSVLPDKIRQLQTTRSPEFLGLSTSSSPNELLTESDWGSNVIIGVLDTGIHPEHRSFADDGLGPVPAHWKGICQEGEKFTKNLCNRKLIGARFFSKGYDAEKRGNGKTKLTNFTDVRSPRDINGHGTHTASTAAGRSVGNASIFGLASGVAVGMAPKARLAVYKICWKNGCMESDILAGMDKAVEDGVNMISISVGGGTATYNLDPIAIGAYAAMQKGILISASAGNEGPTSFSVTNVAPWITSVGASTIDRKFPANLILGDGTVLRGASIYKSWRAFQRRSFPLIYAGNASTDLSHGHAGVLPYPSFSAATCMAGSLDEKKVRGKIVICDRGGSSRVAKGEVVRAAGGVGVVIGNVSPLGEGVIADAHLIPGLGLGESAANKARAYAKSNANASARMTFRGTVVGVKPAPIIAAFSSRGPNEESIYVLKPDVTAPGVNILAAWPDNVPPTETASDSRRTEFNVISGTSMSCPHVSGIAALLRGAHPDWSPAMIRSALMTTAYTKTADGKPLLDEKNYTDSTIWDTGAGHVDPEKALDPGLVFDLTEDDYISFLCASNYTPSAIREITRKPAKCDRKHKAKPWDINYPAIIAVYDNPSLNPNGLDVTVTRTVTHVGEESARYSATLTPPRGANVTLISPAKMRFNAKGQKRSFQVRIKADKQVAYPGKPRTDVGRITWSDGKHQVVSPIVVVWVEVF